MKRYRLTSENAFCIALICSCIAVQCAYIAPQRTNALHLSNDLAAQYVSVSNEHQHPLTQLQIRLGASLQNKDDDAAYMQSLNDLREQYKLRDVTYNAGPWQVTGDYDTQQLTLDMNADSDTQIWDFIDAVRNGPRAATVDTLHIARADNEKPQVHAIIAFLFHRWP